MMEFHHLSVEQVFAALGSDPQGLSPAEAQNRLTRYGPNVLREPPRTPLIRTLLAHFTHLMAWLLWIGEGVAFAAQTPTLGIAIWLVNVINGLFSFWQEYKAEQATAALRRMLPSYARVRRGGEEVRILAERLVPGDVLLLAEGDHISADARLVRETELCVDQSALTGEAHPVRKTAEPVSGEGLSRVELPNLVFAGTSVVAGTGEAVVFATGMRTAFGEIARLTQSVGDQLSPLQREMERLTRAVSTIAVGVGLCFFMLAVAIADIDLANGFIFALGMIVAFVPEGLLPTVTLALAMGTQRMARRNALVKRLSAVETLGCTTVICTDKTGTLTQNEMTVRDIWVGGRSISVSGVGYAPEGQFSECGAPLEQPADDAELRQLLLAASLCNDARLIPPNAQTPSEDRWSILGDPTEAALLVAARKAGIEYETEMRRMPRLRALPFDSRRKRMSVVCRLPQSEGAAHPSAGFVVYVKGAPKELLALCASFAAGDVVHPLDDPQLARILAANDQYARAGLRVLAVAQRTLNALPMPCDTDHIERDLTFLGLVAMMDPPRPEVESAVATCHTAGIRIIMVTGDYGLTAESIARRIGIIREAHPRIVTGAELDSMDEAALRDALMGEVIFARVAPEHKLRVVNALRAQGHVVAVTGDGVNDAPALKQADIGVAMGRSGTDVAREAADIVLTDDNFASIVNAVEEGRAVYANIKKFATYIFTSNTPEAVPFVLFAFSGGRIPIALNVMHILSVDLGTDIVPALALGAEPPEPGVMDRPPRSLHDHVVTGAMLRRAYFWLGPVQSLAAMSAFYYQYWTNGYWGRWLDLPSSGPLYRSATAMALAAVVTTQIGNLFAQRSERLSFLRLPPTGNRLIWIGIATELILIVAIVYVPFLQEIIGTAAFDPINWVFLALWAPALLLVDEMRKWLIARRERSLRR
ncbi:cation-translocating P-type ATPase [Roseiflexus sp. RS-1]|uniref:cation-translocating P-type ATPase n=1 Tax=Roseiflexus sp. (strain RS-1) TaxID=357808 RepID=UPI0000D7FFA2|nr:ATPase, P-type (transporting), HAD superfamily, subfamily IC [Roseiflexus sp. RS-1]